MEKRNGLRLKGMAQHIACAVSLMAVASAWAEENVQAPVLLAQATAAAPAAPPPTATGGRIEEVVITARKDEESQQTVPVSVTALSDDALKKAAVLNVYDLASSVPGLMVTAISNGGAPAFAIRGAKENNGTSATVTAYVDDIPMMSTMAIANMSYDLASVSVLKGPQGTFFGTSTTGGAIIFRPNKPSEVFEGYAELGIGNWGRKTFEGMVNIPINDVLQVRLAGSMVRREGFVTNHNPVNGNENMGDEDHRTMRLSVRLKPTADLLNDLVVNYYHEDSMPDQSIPVALRPRFNFSGFPVDWALAGVSASDNSRDVAIGPHPTWNRVENIDAANTTTYDINENVSIKNVFGFQRVRLATSEDNDATVYEVVNIENKRGMWQWSDEFSVDTKFWDGRLRNKTGVFWMKREFNTDQHGRLLRLPFDLSVLSAGQITAINNNFPRASTARYTRDTESKAIYTQFAYDITDTLTATLGGRYTWDEGDYSAQNRIATPGTTGLGEFGDFTVGNCNANPAATPPTGLATYKNFNAAKCIGYQDFKTSSPSYVFTLENKFSDRQMAYATIRHGYLVGGFNDQVFVPGSYGQVFLPEEVTDTEFGLKSDWYLFDRPIRTNAALFFGHYKNQQRVQNGQTPDGTTFRATLNAGATTFYGWDLDVIYDVTDWLRLTAGWNHVNATYDNFKAPVNIPGSTTAYVDFQGVQLSQAPKDIVNLSATVTWPLETDKGTLTSTLSYYWRDDMVGQDSPTISGPLAPDGEVISIVDDFREWDHLEDYSIVNFTTEWKGVMGSPFDVRLWVKNLFDKEYAIFNSNQMLSFGYATFLYGNPREYGLNVRYNF